MVKNLPAIAGDIRDEGSIPGSGRCPGGEHGNPLQHSCLENPRDGGAWWGAIYGVAQSRTQLKRLSSSSSVYMLGFPGGTSGKGSTCQWRRHKRRGFDPWIGKMPWRRAWQPTPVFSPGESPGQRSLAGCSPWSHRESDTTEPLSVHACDLSWNLASV